MYKDIYQSPLGPLTIEASDKGIRSICRNAPFDENELALSNPYIEQLKRELSEYFDKKRKTFSVSLDVDGYTSFQQDVWKELCKIEYGSTISYKTQAIRLGDVKKIRAVGTANGKNPIPIVIPCHRVIGSNGSLVGYSGGLDMKSFLLELEGMPIQGRLF